MMMGYGTGIDGLAYRFYSDVLNRMYLTDKDLQKVMLDTLQCRQNIERLLNLV
jgi:hypothetical protein